MRFTDRVPYFGLVDWDHSMITGYAHELAGEHTPTRRWFRRQHCSSCGTNWPCYAALWALGELRDTTS